MKAYLFFNKKCCLADMPAICKIFVSAVEQISYHFLVSKNATVLKLNMCIQETHAETNFVI